MVICCFKAIQSNWSTEYKELDYRVCVCVCVCLKTTEIYSLMVPEARSSKSRYRQGYLSAGSRGKSVPYPSFSFSRFQQSLVFLLVRDTLYMISYTFIMSLGLVMCYGLNVCPPLPTKFICWNPNAPCNGIKRWAYRRCLGHEDRALMNGISAFLRRG